jgi:hypothetical protein
VNGNRAVKLTLFAASSVLLTTAGHSAGNPAMPVATNSLPTVMFSELTATLTPPQSNGSGWYNSTVIVHFAVTNFAVGGMPEDCGDNPSCKFDPRGPVKVTPDLVFEQ